MDFVTRRYRIGQRVKLTAVGIEQGLQGRATSPRGVVVWSDPRGWSVRVRRDGLKGVSSYACVFWEPIR